MTTGPSVLQMLEEVLELDSGLTDWEVTFIEDIAKRYEGGRQLTPRQQSKLHQIWEEKT
jgi:hypothetical protein